MNWLRIRHYGDLGFSDKGLPYTGKVHTSQVLRLAPLALLAPPVFSLDSRVAAAAFGGLKTGIGSTSSTFDSLDPRWSSSVQNLDTSMFF